MFTAALLGWVVVKTVKNVATLLDDESTSEAKGKAVCNLAVRAAASVILPGIGEILPVDEFFLENPEMRTNMY